MGFLDDVVQKVKGKGQQFSGEYKNQTGAQVEGNVEKAKGKVNETFADIKLRNRRARRRTTV